MVKTTDRRSAVAGISVTGLQIRGSGGWAAEDDMPLHRFGADTMLGSRV